MSEEFTDISGNYGPEPRCIHCHHIVHDEETGPECDIIKLEYELSILRSKLELVVETLKQSKAFMYAALFSGHAFSNDKKLQEEFVLEIDKVKKVLKELKI